MPEIDYSKIREQVESFPTITYNYSVPQDNTYVYRKNDSKVVEEQERYKKQLRDAWRDQAYKSGNLAMTLMSDADLDRMIDNYTRSMQETPVLSQGREQSPLSPEQTATVYSNLSNFYTSLGSPSRLPMTYNQALNNPQTAYVASQGALNDPALAIIQLAAPSGGTGAFSTAAKAVKAGIRSSAPISGVLKEAAIAGAKEVAKAPSRTTIAGVTTALPAAAMASDGDGVGSILSLAALIGGGYLAGKFGKGAFNKLKGKFKGKVSKATDAVEETASQVADATKKATEETVEQATKKSTKKAVEEAIEQTNPNGIPEYKGKTVGLNRPRNRKHIEKRWKQQTEEHLQERVKQETQKMINEFNAATNDPKKFQAFKKKYNIEPDDDVQEIRKKLIKARETGDLYALTRISKLVYDQNTNRWVRSGVSKMSPTLKELTNFSNNIDNIIYPELPKKRRNWMIVGDVAKIGVPTGIGLLGIDQLGDAAGLYDIDKDGHFGILGGNSEMWETTTRYVDDEE